MTTSREFVTFQTTDVRGKDWQVHVGREVIEDAQASETSLSDDEMETWVNDNAVFLSEFALWKIARGECGPDWVRIGSAELCDWLGSSQR